MRMILFPILATMVHALMHYYVWRRLVRDTNLPGPWQKVATGVIVVLGVGFPVVLWTARLYDQRVGQIGGWPVFIWMAMVWLLVNGLLLWDALRLSSWPVRRLWSLAARGRDRAGQASAGHAPRSAGATQEVGHQVDLGRRQLMARVAGGSIAALAAGAVGTGLREVLKEHEVVEVPVSLARLPASMDGFAIVQLTDIHVGMTVTRSFVERIVARANQARPDLIAITGDLVDGDVPSLRQAVAPLRDLHAPHGVYFVTGNHEYYAGVEPWLDELTRLGIRVLRNERVSIGQGADSFDLAGIDDHGAAGFGRGHGPDLARAVKDRDPGRELVLLAHQPRQVHHAVAHGVGLQLSGHTHGGQIWPWHYLVMAQQEGLLCGLMRRGDTQLYVSRGTGYWGPPIRVGAPAEISRIVLRASREA